MFAPMDYDILGRFRWKAEIIKYNMILLLLWDDDTYEIGKSWTYAQCAKIWWKNAIIGIFIFLFSPYCKVCHNVTCCSNKLLKNCLDVSNFAIIPRTLQTSSLFSNQWAKAHYSTRCLLFIFLSKNKWFFQQYDIETYYINRNSRV